MTDKLQILRTLDKANRFSPMDIFKLLTDGRLDASGDFTKGCGLSQGSALMLICITIPKVLRRMNKIIS